MAEIRRERETQNAEAIRIGCEAFPDMHIGAGSVINAVQATAADAIGFRPVSIRKRAEVRRFYATSALKNGNGLSDRSYVTSLLSPFLIASENLLGSVLGKMKSEKTSCAKLGKAACRPKGCRIDQAPAYMVSYSPSSSKKLSPRFFCFGVSGFGVYRLSRAVEAVRLLRLSE